MSKNNKKIRLKIWKRNSNCYVCKKKILDFNDSSLEHLLPKSLGGKNHQKNLAISHKICNSLRGNIVCPVVLNFKCKDLTKEQKFKSEVRAWKIKLKMDYLDWIISNNVNE